MWSALEQHLAPASGALRQKDALILQIRRDARGLSEALRAPLQCGCHPTLNHHQLQKALGGVDYPASKEELVKNAEGKDADEDVLSFLKDLPDRKYETPADVNKEMS